jgi:hypothetical protein
LTSNCKTADHLPYFDHLRSQSSSFVSIRSDSTHMVDVRGNSNISTTMTTTKSECLHIPFQAAAGYKVRYHDGLVRLAGTPLSSSSSSGLAIAAHDLLWLSYSCEPFRPPVNTNDNSLMTCTDKQHHHPTIHTISHYRTQYLYQVQRPSQHQLAIKEL